MRGSGALKMLMSYHQHNSILRAMDPLIPEEKHTLLLRKPFKIGPSCPQ